MQPIGESHCQLELKPSAISGLRLFTRTQIASWPFKIDEDIVDAVELALSELATNVLRHASGPAFIELRGWPPSLVRVEVHDASVRLPVVRESEDTDEFGRGIDLVRMLSEDRMGWWLTGAGKCVWAEFGSDAVAVEDEGDLPMAV